MPVQFDDITHAIQLAVAPVFLLTAIATLINVMSGRLSRVVDRRRLVLGRMPHGADLDAPAALTDDGKVTDDAQEIAMLDRRSRLIYKAIFFAVLGALLVCLVVGVAFVGALYAWNAARPVALLFILAMSTVVLSLGMFLREIYLAVQTGGHRRR